jgi:hypothetical protein
MKILADKVSLYELFTDESSHEHGRIVGKNDAMTTVE